MRIKVNGGAICAEDNTSLSFGGTSNFINNSADFGQGVYLDLGDSSFSISSNTTLYIGRTIMHL